MAADYRLRKKAQNEGTCHDGSNSVNISLEAINTDVLVLSMRSLGEVWIIDIGAFG